MKTVAYFSGNGFNVTYSLIKQIVIKRPKYGKNILNEQPFNSKLHNKSLKNTLVLILS